jgi:hypothetical protein
MLRSIAEPTHLAGRRLLCFNIIYWLCSRNRKMIQWNTVIVGLIFQQSIALFVLKSGAGFSLFKWIANAAADFLHQGGLAATFFSGNDPTYTAWFLFGTLGAVIFFIAFVQMVRHPLPRQQQRRAVSDPAFALRLPDVLPRRHDLGHPGLQLAFLQGAPPALGRRPRCCGIR